MKITKFILLIFMASIPLLLAAQDREKDPKHPIDLAFENCLQKTKANLPRAKCYSTASEMWEKVVAADYQKLLTELSPELQKVLIAEQSAREKYRTENQNFVMAKYGNRRGIGHIPVRIILLMKPNRERALELENRFEN